MNEVPLLRNGLDQTEGEQSWGSSQSKNNYSAEMWSGSEEGSYLRLLDCRITHYKAREY